MRHAYFGKKLSRTKNERRRLFRNLLRDLISHGKIVTTLSKAKAVQPLMEKLITKAKIGSQQKEREIFAVLTDKEHTDRLLDMAKTRFAHRSSGFTHIIKLGFRSGDATEKVRLGFIDEEIVVEQIAPKTEAKQTKIKEKIEKKESIKKRVQKKNK